MRPIHRLALGYAAVAMAPYLTRADEETAHALVAPPEHAPAQSTGHTGNKYEPHQGKREMARRAKRAAKAPTPASGDTQGEKEGK